MCEPSTPQFVIDANSAISVSGMSMVLQNYSTIQKSFFRSSVSGSLTLVLDKAMVGEISGREYCVRKRHLAVK